MKKCNLIKEKLLFRRQFILGPHFIEMLKNWRKRKINNIFLTIHPDLGYVQATHKKKTLTLLGFILDPDNPHFNDLNILNRLILQINKFNDLFELTENMGGRWILIFSDGNDTILFNDAAGLRQVFYSKDKSGIWCASQPGIIAEELNLEIDEEALNTFINSPEYRNHAEYWWPGESSPFKEIIHLLPNHYLDLEDGICYRYWPYKKLNEISLKQGITISSKLLKGLITSAHNRFDLALPITSGWDSRLLLAACKEIKKDIFYYTMSFYSKKSPDIQIPNELLRKLGLKHNIIDCFSLDFDKKFMKIYKKNVITSHDIYCIIAQGLYKYYPQHRISMNGNVSEIARYGRRLKENEKATANNLSKLFGMGHNSFAIKNINKWLIEVKDVNNKYNINIRDLFYWEQRMGNWQAMNQLEFDIAQETFTPYNCRKLLITLLSVNERYRQKPNYILYKKLIKNLWAETLIKPINPRSSILNIFIHFINGIIFYFKFDFYNQSMLIRNIERCKNVLRARLLEK